MSELSEIIKAFNRREISTSQLEKKLKQLMLDMTEPEYTQAYKAGDATIYEILVRIRERMLKQ